MTTRIILAFLAVAFAFAGVACRSSMKEKMSNAPASEMEASFKQRWIEKRTGELVAAGVIADAAREKAAGEFKTQFEYIRSSK